jgi:glycosyltransferase involved in cell wall biosynthesis
VSVILSVYNHAALLGRAIESVLAQTTRDWELVIADDGSTDRSRHVAEAYAARADRIRVIALPHRGLSAAVNAAFRFTTGLYLTALDADDYYRAHHLEDNLRYLRKHPETDLVMSRAEVIGDPHVVDLERPGRMIHLDRCVIGGTLFVKRAVFEAVGAMPAIGFGMDYHFAKAVERAGYVVRKRRARTYVYDRRRGGFMTKAAEMRMKASRQRSRRLGGAAGPSGASGTKRRGTS